MIRYFCCIQFAALTAQIKGSRMILTGKAIGAYCQADSFRAIMEPVERDRVEYGRAQQVDGRVVHDGEGREAAEGL